MLKQADMRSMQRGSDGQVVLGHPGQPAESDEVGSEALCDFHDSSSR